MKAQDVQPGDVIRRRDGDYTVTRTQRDTVPSHDRVYLYLTRVPGIALAYSYSADDELEIVT